MKQRYDSYKPSGIDWIGDIPSHWNVTRLKHLIRMKSGDTLSSEQMDPAEGCYPVFGGNGKRGFYSDFNTQGDYVLIGRQGALCGNINYAHGKFWATEHAVVCYPLREIALLWIGELLRAMNLNQYNVSAAQPGLAIERIKNLLIPVPPLAEQEAIAAWLDTQCGEIDAAIAKVDREIELIDELKQSEISRVVTRGLNPDAPLLPSGIDWIGDIPEHWKKSRIKNHISRSAAGVWGDDEKGNKNDIICFRIADFNYGERCLSFDKITIRNIDPKQLEGRYLSKGDLLIEKSGGGETTPVGRVVYCNFDGKATYTNFIHSITLSDNVDSRFFLYYFNMLYSNKINLLYFNQTTGLQNLQIGEYLGQAIYLPPLSEQQAIADYLDKKCAEIDGLKAKLNKKRETLKELRQSIISEVVTGKRKVI